MDGFAVMPMDKAAALGDVFITVTGDIGVLRAEHFKKMKDGAILANSGHFNVEIDIPALAKMAKTKREARPFVDEYTLPGGRRQRSPPRNSATWTSARTLRWYAAWPQLAPMLLAPRGSPSNTCS
jgi:hypothetical protein